MVVVVAGAAVVAVAAVAVAAAAGVVDVALSEPLVGVVPKIFKCSSHLRIHH